MKLSDVIKILSGFKKQHGDLTLIVSKGPGDLQGSLLGGINLGTFTTKGDYKWSGEIGKHKEGLPKFIILRPLQ